MTYAVVKYFNYRKEVTVEVLAVFNSEDKAIERARESAEGGTRRSGRPNNEEVVEGVQDVWVSLTDPIVEYTTGDGCDRYVYAVISLPEPEDADSEPDSDPDAKPAAKKRKSNARGNAKKSGSSAKRVKSSKKA